MLELLLLTALLADPGGFKIVHEKLPAKPGTEFKIVFEKLPNKQTAPSRRQLIFVAKWCQYCPKENGEEIKALRKANWTVSAGTDSQVQLVDVEANPELASKYQVTSLPTYLVLVDNKIVSKHVGKLTVAEITDQYNQTGGFKTAATNTQTRVSYRIEWPGMTEESLRDHLSEAPHNINAAGWSFQQMVDWHDDWHVKHPNQNNVRQTRKGKRR